MPIYQGESCSIVRTCDSCGQTKFYLNFAQKKNKRNRKSTCKDCTSKIAMKNKEDIKNSHIERREDDRKYRALIKVSRQLAEGKRFSTNNFITSNYSKWLGSYNVFKNGKILKNVHFTQEEVKTLIDEGSCRISIEYPFILIFFYPINLDSLRPIIFERDEHKCYFCGNEGNTIDHLTPVSKGGLNTPKNCVCSCPDCNVEKGNLTFEEYIEKRKLKGRVVKNKKKPDVKFHGLGKIVF